MTHPTPPTDPVEGIRKALEAGPTSALYTHPRDDNNWMANEAFASACNPAAIRALLDRLDSAERALSAALWHIKNTAVSLADAQVIALEALAAFNAKKGAA